MARTILPRPCVLCQGQIETEYKLIGEDQSGWPAEPPAVLLAHVDCVEAMRIVGFAIVRPGQQISDVLPVMVQAFA